MIVKTVTHLLWQEYEGRWNNISVYFRHLSLHFFLKYKCNHQLPNTWAFWKKVLILFCFFANIALSFYKSDPRFYLLKRLRFYRCVKKKFFSLPLASSLILLIQFLILRLSHFISQTITQNCRKVEMEKLSTHSNLISLFCWWRNGVLGRWNDLLMVRQQISAYNHIL